MRMTTTTVVVVMMVMMVVVMMVMMIMMVVVVVVMAMTMTPMLLYAFIPPPPPPPLAPSTPLLLSLLMMHAAVGPSDIVPGTLVPVLQWYGGDFGDTMTSRLEAIAKFLPPATADDLRSMLKNPQEPKVTYPPYDWGVNKK